MDRKNYKYCISRDCRNTTVTASSKEFVRLPTDEIKRRNWLEAVGRNLTDFSPSSICYVCEDHFNLEEDMENFFKWRLIGGRKTMKDGAVPHLRHSLVENTNLYMQTTSGQSTVTKGYVMMPSLDHCINNSPKMTTITNTLEVFDTYKHREDREDKDSDEESFHLPLDDDESELKFQEPIKNGNGHESEDEILNKFDTTTATFEHIDSQLEESLLNDEEEEKKGIAFENIAIADVKLEAEQSTQDENPLETKDKENSQKEEKINDNRGTEEDGDQCDRDISPEHGQLSKSEDSSANEIPLVNDAAECVEMLENDENQTEKALPVENEAITINEVASDDVPKLDVEENLSSTVEEGSAIDPLWDKTDEEAEIEKPASISEPEKAVNGDSTMEVDATTENEPEVEEQMKDKSLPSENEVDKDNLPKTEKDVSTYDDTKSPEKCDNSDDPSKQHNEDSEDLFDISIIRDAEEDNAESAYNEAHPEESNMDENEEYDDRNDEKVDDEVNDKEEDDEEEMDIDKHEDQLKTDDVEIEEANLKLECDGTKEGVSDGEGDNNSKTDIVQISSKQTLEKSETSNGAEASVNECRLDEVTGQLVGGEAMEVDLQESSTKDSLLEKEETKDDEDSQKRKSLKRSLEEDAENGVAKKSRTDPVSDVEIKEVEKPKEKLPLRTLLSLTDFMKTKKNNRRLTMHDLEEFCVQKMCEVIVHKSDLGDVHHHLKLQEQLIETMRKEIQQLTKQTRDLEIVNKKLLNDLKQQNTTQKPLNPLKITRSVGLQVKFTPAFEANMKRRQPAPTTPGQKLQVLASPNRGPRIIPTAAPANLTRPVPSPQKQQQQHPAPKPNTPLLSQALQNRRSSDVTNKASPQTARAKPADPKTGAPSASVIDLTDEDDKKDKNKTTPTKMVPPKSITVPLRTTPMRVNTTAQGIRLTTSQGKVSPITSVVTSSSAPQVMYVVQSSPQNALTSGLGGKAVVVNFQSANGVITSTLNGSAVSVIPKQSNTIQLKTVAAAKTLPSNKVVKMTSKHPAPLPPPPVIRVNSEKPLKPIPPKPHLTIRKTDTGIILQWKMPYELDMYEVIASYQLYAYQETSALPNTDMWRKVGDVKALALPMACTLTQFADKNKYYFAVRPVDIHKRIGMFSEPEEISL